MGAAPRPAAEVTIDEELVAALVGQQHPDLQAPLTPVASGWDNVVMRLGDHLAVRLPRRRAAVELVAREWRWLPQLARVLPLEVPTPMRAGQPACGYPWPWSIVRWVPGRVLLESPTPPSSVAAVQALTAFFDVLHRPAPTGAPENPYRGVPLGERADRVEEHLRAAGAELDLDRIRSVWAGALAAEPWARPAVWVHGDLHPGNLVARGGRLTGVIDFGDLTAGDPAVDLGVAWMVLDPEARRSLRTATSATDATWERARGSALAHAAAVLARSADAPAMAAMARRTLTAVLGDDDG